MKCRHCGKTASVPLIDLATSPPSNAYLPDSALKQPELWFPLKVLVCESCWLVQTEDFVGREHLFDEDYAYFSSFSASWLTHASEYVTRMAERFHLTGDAFHIEVASNDGYLLQFSHERGIPCLGVEPTASTAKAARAKGVETLEAFFGTGLAKQLRDKGKSADLMTANNVLAHVPDINDFVRGFAILLKPNGVATFEFPHLMKLMAEAQFDTIYHEHYSYLSLTAVSRIFQHCGLEIFDVEHLTTHGGSLRVFAQLQGGSHTKLPAVEKLLEKEEASGLTSVPYYGGLQERAEAIKYELTSFLIEAKRSGKTVGAYGAAAKGNTLINFAGIKPDLLPWVVDKNPAKQGKFLPGSRIPIVPAKRLFAEKPDYLLILPWNLRDEVIGQIREDSPHWTPTFVVAIPSLEFIR